MAIHFINHSIYLSSVQGPLYRNNRGQQVPDLVHLEEFAVELLAENLRKRLIEISSERIIDAETRWETVMYQIE